MQRVSSTNVITRRRGLAPLELVLTLPLLLMVMALMILLGTAAAWKVRASTNSRQAVLRSIWPRTTDNDRNPSNWWPSSATMRYAGGGPSPFEEDPFSGHEVVRGPTIGSPTSGNSLTVKIDTLDMTDGLRSGVATIDHDPPIWGRLGYRNRFNQRTVVFAGQTWEYGSMGLGSNRSRRIEATYDYELDRYDPEAAGRTYAARGKLLANPYRPQLAVLDRDDELRAWYGNYIDFHPHPPNLCTNDPEVLREEVLPPLLDRIAEVPRSMASTFLNMYRGQLALLDAMDPQPPNAGALRAELEEKIRQLEEFLATL